jgi:hypothetical protein
MSWARPSATLASPIQQANTFFFVASGLPSTLTTPLAASAAEATAVGQ